MTSRGPAQQRYPDARRRIALPPAVIAIMALLVQPALGRGDAALVVLYVVSILALICGWFAIQARQWWTLPLLVSIAVVWNPVFPFDFRGVWWQAAQYLAAIVFLAVGAAVRVRMDQGNGARQP